MLFKDIIGQEKIKNHLIQTVKQNRIPHAQMFSGPPGVGKLPMALAYVQYINCKNKQENDACGQCDSCKKFRSLVYADLHFIFPTFNIAGSKTKGSDNFLFQWREKLLDNPYFDLMQWALFIDPKGTKQLTIYKDDSDNIIHELNVKSYEDGYKIVILWLPEKLNLTAANKLLKIIEEPYPKTVFILVTEAIDKVLPTIISRTQLIKFPKLRPSEIENFLTRKYPNLTSLQANNFAHIAKGNLIEAEKLVNLAPETTDTLLQDFILFMRLCYRFNFTDLYSFVDKLSGRGREYLKNFFFFSIRMLRENLLMNLKLQDLNSMSKTEYEFSEKFSYFITHKKAKDILNEMNLAFFHIERNGNIKLILFDLALKTGQILRKK